MTIAELNDMFRTNPFGDLYLTRSISSMPTSVQAEIIGRVRTFDTFSPDYDRYGEHDFGSFEYSGQTIFWKIDCYDTKLKLGSPDPANPALTRRVLTILLAEEY
jgi:hypothetical protein